MPLRISDKADRMKQTIVLKVSSRHPDIEKVRIAANFVKEGGVVAFPTETVYGLGADALNQEAVLALFEAKERPLDNPPIVHIQSVDDVYRLAEHVPSMAERLMREFWPGPLTLIFERSKIVPDVTVAGLDTVAVRMPLHAVALSLIEESNRPIAAPSANLAGRPSSTSAMHVLDDLNGRIDAILDGGPTHIGVESTVLDLRTGTPQVLRPGGTSLEALKTVLGEVKLHPFVVAEKELSIEKIRSPGMKHKHYAPNAKLVVVEGTIPAVLVKVKELADFYRLEGAKVGVLATDETLAVYEADVVKSLGSRINLAVVAQNLFGLLREFDAESVDVIIAEGVPTEGLGLAVMNRLRKASNYHIVKAE
jgi:L-threonylcarbamoyladenylate synthase